MASPTNYVPTARDVCPKADEYRFPPPEAIDRREALTYCTKRAMATTVVTPVNSATGQLDSVIEDLCQRLRSASSEPPELRVQQALGQLTTALGFDAGFILRTDGERGSVRLATGAQFDATLADLVTWPWVNRAVRRTGVLVLGVPTGDSEVAADDRRRLWALGIGSLFYVPFQDRDFQEGALLLCGRHSLRIWSTTAVPALITAAETFRLTLRGSDPTPPSIETPEPVDAEAPSKVPSKRLPGSSLTRDHDIVGVSPAWRYVMFRVDQVATTHATVLLLGETGTGKELVARAIHRRSPRATARFVALNCSALPTPLVESELFGHERGAFTGAHAAQPGRFELAHRGSLFLDEVGDLPLELQPKLLRVLQEGQFDRLGGSHTFDVDVRVIAATNRDLLDEVRHARFRQDLYYRLNVFPITLPSLRERREDIPLLAAHLAARFSKALRKNVAELSPAVIERLQEHDWPGNIRELENVIQRAIIMSTNGVLSLREINLARAQPTQSTTGTTLEEVEREHILRMLGLTSWRIEGAGGAARLLGLKPSTLRSRLHKLGIRRGL
jgi:transcriptional regulator with GAF, ATPase, and Fis domain